MAEHHRMNCTVAQFNAIAAVVEWMKTDEETKDAEFVIDGRTRTITADRLCWNRLRSAADIKAAGDVLLAADTEAMRKITAAAAMVDRDVFAMLQEKSSRVEVQVKPKRGTLFDA